MNDPQAFGSQHKPDDEAGKSTGAFGGSFGGQRQPDEDQPDGAPVLQPGPSGSRQKRATPGGEIEGRASGDSAQAPLPGPKPVQTPGSQGCFGSLLLLALVTLVCW